MSDVPARQLIVEHRQEIRQAFAPLLVPHEWAAMRVQHPQGDAQIPGAALYVVPEGGHLPIFAGEREAFERRVPGWLGARR